MIHVAAGLGLFDVSWIRRQSSLVVVVDVVG